MSINNGYQKSTGTSITVLLIFISTCIICSQAFGETVTLYPTDDSYVSVDLADDASWCNSSTVSIGTYDQLVAYIKFNLNSIPVGSNVTNATLRLYPTAIIDNSNVGICLTLSAWSECNLTWSGHPSGGWPCIESQPPGISQWWEISVTDLVEEWIENGESNWGFRLEKASSGIVMFYSSESSYDPELVVTYTPNTCTADGQVLSSTDGFGVLNTRMQFSRVSGTGNIPNDVYSDVQGNWYQSGFEDDGTVYRVTPTHNAYGPFTPQYLDFTCANSSGLDFTVPTSYSVTIQSNPSGASIRIGTPDNPVECYTPCTLTNLEGNVIIWLTLEGYKDLEYVLGPSDGGSTIVLTLTESIYITMSPPYIIHDIEHTFTEYSHAGVRGIVWEPSDQDPTLGLVRNRSQLLTLMAGTSSFSVDNRIMIPFTVATSGRYRITATGALSGEIRDALGFYYYSINDCRHSIMVGSRLSTGGGNFQDIFSNLDQPFPDEIQWMTDNVLKLIQAFIDYLNNDWSGFIQIGFEALAGELEFIYDLISPAEEFHQIPIQTSFLTDLNAGENYILELMVWSGTSGGTSGGILFTEVDVTAEFSQITIEEDATGTMGPILSVEPSWHVELLPAEVGETITNNSAFVITNIGDQHLDGTALIEIGPFEIISGATISLEPYEQATLGISFQSDEVGNHKSYISFTGGGYTERLVSCTVYEPAPQLTVVPDQDVDFGEISLGESFEQVAFSVTNTGGGLLSGSVSVETPFEIVNGSTFNLSQGESQPVRIRFTPTEEGEILKEVEFSNGGTIFRTLRGSGVTPSQDEYLIVFDEYNASGWFGGDDRASHGPRNIGVGQSVYIDSSIVVHQFAFYFTHRFDYPENPEGVGHEVTLALNIRDELGSILKTVHTTVPDSFSGGWISWPNINVAAERNSTLIFTAYLLGAYDINQYMTGNASDANAGYPGGVRYTKSGTSDSDMEYWSGWNIHVWDSNFKLEGTTVIESSIIIVTDVASVAVPEGGTATFRVKLSSQPQSTTTVSVSRYSGDSDISVSSGSSLSFTTSNWSTYQTVTLSAAEDADTENGTATIRCSASVLDSKDVTATEGDNDTGPVSEYEGDYYCLAGGGSAVFNISVAGDIISIDLDCSDCYAYGIVRKKIDYIIENGADFDFKISTFQRSSDSYHRGIALWSDEVKTKFLEAYVTDFGNGTVIRTHAETKYSDTVNPGSCAIHITRINGVYTCSVSESVVWSGEISELEGEDLRYGVIVERSSGPNGHAYADYANWDFSLATVEVTHYDKSPKHYNLEAAYPNPFNPATTIGFSLPVPSAVTLTIFNLSGREMIRLVNGIKTTGYHSVVWDGKDYTGLNVPSGIYIARLATPGYTKSIKMLLLK